MQETPRSGIFVFFFSFGEDRKNDKKKRRHKYGSIFVGLPLFSLVKLQRISLQKEWWYDFVSKVLKHI